jgi:hypothetical protein
MGPSDVGIPFRKTCCGISRGIESQSEKTPDLTLDQLRQQFQIQLSSHPAAEGAYLSEAWASLAWIKLAAPEITQAGGVALAEIDAALGCLVAAIREEQSNSTLSAAPALVGNWGNYYGFTHGAGA